MLTYVQRFVVGVITQGLLYGIYLATFVQSFRWFIFTDEGWKPREKMTSFTVAFGTIFIFLMTTTNLITTLAYMIKYEEGYMFGIAMAMATSELLATITIDGVLIYRCWIVYGKSWRIIFVPVTFWLASLACSAFDIYLSLGRQDLPNILQNEEKTITGIYVCNIATTIYVTTAIIYRIWRTRKTNGNRPNRLNYIMRILAESGVLYTSTIIFSLVGTVLTAKSDATWVDMLIGNISDAINFSMAGITFNLLHIRVKSRVERQDSLADSRNVDGVRSLSGMQFNDPQITASSEGLPSKARPLDVIDEIQERRRSSDGMN